MAPGSASPRGELRRGAAILERLGYDVRVAAQAFLRDGFLAGSDARRAASFRAALRDPAVGAIFFARGGYGAARLLPLVARDLARARPKILVGYSDSTALLAHASGRLGWTTFHGPMVATDLPALRPAHRRDLVEVLSGERVPSFPLARTLRPGVAEGTLLGGCLSLLASLVGTPHQSDFTAAILFLEDVNEPPYRLDRMLTQLRHAGALDGVAGIVFGEMARCRPRGEVARVLAERTSDLGVPVALGLPSGHGAGKRTLPLGVRARLDARRRRLAILEPVVEA